jgi:hypothetical protein
LGEGEDVQVEGLIPVGVQRLLDHARGTRLLSVDGRDGEWVGKAWGCDVSGAVFKTSGEGQHTENIALVEAVGGDD